MLFIENYTYLAYLHVCYSKSLQLFLYLIEINFNEINNFMSFFSRLIESYRLEIVFSYLHVNFPKQNQVPKKYVEYENFWQLDYLHTLYSGEKYDSLMPRSFSYPKQIPKNDKT